MRILFLIGLLIGIKASYAHNPEISSLMIYEQNGKTILLIKTALTAFEAEVENAFGKQAYQTPEEFNQLAIQHFKKNCLVAINGDLLEFSNIQLQLGHEANLFAELNNLPKVINSFYIKNTIFKNIHDNQCEVILTLNGLPQKQYVLNNNNGQEVMLNVADNIWIENKSNNSFFRTTPFKAGSAVLLISMIIFYILKKKKSHNRRILNNPKSKYKILNYEDKNFNCHTALCNGLCIL